MSVHYKFKSALEYDTVTFDGLHISLRDLKKAILHQKRIGKNTDFDLQVTNAQSKEVYTEDSVLIAKNTSLIIARIPLTAQQKKAWDRAESNQALSGVKSDAILDGQDPGLHRLSKAVDLSSLDASEEDKILAMMSQSTQDYSPSNYLKVRGATQMGEVPANYRCFRCFQPGHWIKNCPLSSNQERESIEIKKSTGIPRSFMVPVEGPLVPGAMMTPAGTFAVPAVDHQAYKEGKKERPPFQPEPEQPEEKPDIPEDLLCTVCRDLLTDAVMIPCCGNSFCDECVRTVLLESEDHECPDCKEKDVSPDTLIPNRFLRNAVNNFRNETGYSKIRVRQPVAPPAKLQPAVIQAPEVLAHVASGSPAGQPIPEQIHGTSPMILISSRRHEHIQHPHPHLHEGGGLLPPNDEMRHVHVSAGSHHPPPPGVVPGEGVPVMTRPPHHVYPGPPVGPPGVTAPAGPIGSLVSHPQGPALHIQPIHQGYPPQGSVRRSQEERPGTPTIDERTLDAVLPDTSVPPPNLSAASSEPAFRPQRAPQMYRALAPAPQPYAPAPVSIPQPIRAFVPHGPQFDTRMPFHHDPNAPQSSRPPHYVELDGGHRGYRGGYRGRSRGYSAGPYRGALLPPLGRPSHHNGTQASGIADTLAVFERMIREKDDRDRRRRARRSRSRSLKRSYSRSRSRTRSRSRSYTRSPPRKRERDRSRTPRSRSFTISRSRSRSYSRSPLPPPRERSPPPRDRSPLPRERERERTPLREREREYSPRRDKEDRRDYSPRREKERDREFSPRRDKEYSPRRRPEHPPRYRSPARSPTRYPAHRDRGYKDAGFKDARDFKDPRDYKDYKDSRDFKDARDYKDYAPDFYPPEPDFDRGGGRSRPYGGAARSEAPLPPHPRKDKEYYNPPSTSAVARYPTERYPVRERIEAQLPLVTVPVRNYDLPPARYDIPLVPPAARSALHRPYDPEPPRYDAPNYRRSYESMFDTVPPGTGPDLPIITSTTRFERTFDRSSYNPSPPAYQGPVWEKDKEKPPRERDFYDREREPRGHDKQYYSPSTEAPKKRRLSRSQSRDSRDKVDSLDRREGREDRDRRAKGKENTKEDDDRKEKERERKDRDKKVEAEVPIDKKKDDKDKKSKDKKKKKKEQDDKKKKKREKKKEKESKKEVPIVKVDKKEKREKEDKEEMVLPPGVDYLTPPKEEVKVEPAKEKPAPLPAGKQPPPAKEAESKAKTPTPTILRTFDAPPTESLYADIDDARIDGGVVASYGKTTAGDGKAAADGRVDSQDSTTQDEANTSRDEESEGKEEDKKAEMLAPMPELSKWEREEGFTSPTADKVNKSEEDAAPGEQDKMVTSEVLKRAENAIFQKAINAIRPLDGGARKAAQEPAKPPEEKAKKPHKERKEKEPKTGDPERGERKSKVPEVDREARKVANSIQITIPVEIPALLDMSVPVPAAPKVRGKLDRSKFSSANWTKPEETPSPARISAKERLGARVEPERSGTARGHGGRKTLRSLVETARSGSRSPHRRVEDRRVEERRLEERRLEERRLEERRLEERRLEERRLEERRLEERRLEERRLEEERRYDERRDRRVEYRRDRRREGGGERRSPEREEKKKEERHVKPTHKKAEAKVVRKKSISDKETRRSKKKEKKHRDKKKKVKEEEKAEKKEVSDDKEAKVSPVVTAPEEPPPDAPAVKKPRKNPRPATADRRKTTLDEASFEPDYDLSSAGESEEEKKSLTPPPGKEAADEGAGDKKKAAKTTEDDKKAKKRRSTSKESESSSDSSSESSSSEESSDESAKKRKRKHRKHRRKKVRRETSSDSDTDSESEESSSESEGRRKKNKKHHRRNKAKVSKKKKKSKHR